MDEPRQDPVNLEEAPRPLLRKRRRPQVVWLIPMVALLMGAWLAFKTYRETGPTITITFQSGEGIEADRTRIKCKDVEVGKVRTVTLSPDRSRVVVTAEVTRSTEALLTQHTHFWVVRARVSATGISGLGTLLSGAYIAMDPGAPGEPRQSFDGLDVPPSLKPVGPGSSFNLRAERVGTLNVGSPVYNRQVRVGEVVGFDLEPEGQSVAIQVFVHAPYDKLVHEDTRFWNAGTVEATVGASGFRVSADSWMDMLLGGIAFENLPSLEATKGVTPNQVFVLYPSHDHIYERTYLHQHRYLLRFPDSVRGLSRGAPVEFQGVRVGQVEDLKLAFDPAQLRGEIPVLIALEPERFNSGNSGRAKLDDLMRRMVAKGLRAQLRQDSLLTGSLYVALDYHPGAAPKALATRGSYPEIPTLSTANEGIAANLEAFLKRLQALPLEAMAQDARAALPALREALDQAKHLMSRLDQETAPQAKATLAQAQATLATLDRALRSDAPLQQDLRTALEEFSKAARALRDLAELLERQPESLLRGKRKEP